MEHRHTTAGERLILRLDRGEEVIERLTTFCVDHGIAGATLSGIGAVKDAELGYYDLGSFSYRSQTIAEVCELVSLLGNVARLDDGSTFVHAHATLGDRDLRLRGGHLVRATVAVTVEVALDPLPQALARAFDPEVKLKLLEL